MQLLAKGADADESLHEVSAVEGVNAVGPYYPVL